MPSSPKTFEICDHRRLTRQVASWCHVPGNFCRRKNLTSRDAVPTAVGIPEWLFQQPYQLREPWKQRDAHADREGYDGGDQIFIQNCVRGEDHGGDGGGHGGDEYDDGSFDAGEVQHPGSTESKEQPARHAHQDAEHG